ncbi:MAG: sensor histidine kinase [Lachnospiraceae bacterium]
MSIKKKVFITLLTMITTVLLLSYLVIYSLFYQTLVSRIEAEQNTLISLNQNLIESFIKTMDQTAILLVGDEAIGKYLSQEIPDTMTKIMVKNGICKQFSHYLSLQPTKGNSFCQNTLFLNSALPVSTAFTSETLETSLPWRSSNIYSNEQVATQEWYRQTLNSPNKTYLFVNHTTGEFCYARKIQNNYYTGSYLSDGLAVIVMQIPLDKLEETLTMTPITPNSGFLLIRNDFEILFESGKSRRLTEDLLSYFQEQEQTLGILPAFRSTLTLDGVNYITYYKPLEDDLSLVFFTPYPDILSQVEKITSIYITFSLFFITLAAFLAFMISHWLTRPIIRFSTAIASIDDTRSFDLHTLQVSKDLEIESLRENFGKLISRINTLIEDMRLQGEHQTQYKLRALQAQINPHFIYNAMDTVSWIALSKNEDEIAAIVSSVSNLMRYSISDPDSLVPLTQELANVREYIAIQQIRYGNSIDLEIISDLSVSQVFIPKFTVQPLIENSITHGNYPPHTIIQITVSVYQKNNSLIIEILDNGEGCDPQLLNHYLSYEEVALSVNGGFGIRNVNERIQLHFGGNSGLKFMLKENKYLAAVLTLDSKEKKQG